MTGMNSDPRTDAHGPAAPAIVWIPLLTAAFVVPLWWVVSTDTPFDTVRGWILETFGEDSEYTYLLAYLLCVIPLLIPAGIIIRLASWMTQRRANAVNRRSG